MYSFLSLLGATFLAALVVCGVTLALFLPPMTWILKRRLSPDAATLWVRIFGFTIFVVGVSIGARIWDLERYMSARPVSADKLWLEVYSTVLATSEAELAVVLFGCLAVGLVVLMKRNDKPGSDGPAKSPL